MPPLWHLRLWFDRILDRSYMISELDSGIVLAEIFSRRGQRVAIAVGQSELRVGHYPLFSITLRFREGSNTWSKLVRFAEERDRTLLVGDYSYIQKRDEVVYSLDGAFIALPVADILSIQALLDLNRSARC